MTFENPAALWWLLLAVPIAAIHLITLFRVRAEVSSHLIWRRALARRSMWQRWRRLAALAAHLTLLMLIVLAAAAPTFSSGDRRTVVIVVDCSAGMNATDVAPSRFDRAKADAWRLVDALESHERAAVISAGGQVRVHCGPTEDHALLEEAIAGIEATDGPSGMPRAVALARRMLLEEGGGEIIVLTDGAFPQARELREAKQVRLAVYGRDGDNAAITRFETRTRLDDPTRHDVLVEVQNYSATAVDLELGVGTPGGEVQTRSLDLPPGGARQVVETVTAPDGGLIVAHLDRADLLAADNLAQAIVAPPKQRGVRLIGRASPELRLCVSAAGRVIVADSAAGVAVLNEPDGSGLPQAPALIIAPRSSTPLWTVQDVVEGTIDVGTIDAFWPGDIRLSEMAIERLVAVSPVSGRVVAATADGRPVLVLFEPTGDHRHRTALLTTPLDGTDLVKRPDFPLLLSALLDWLAGEDALARVREASYSTDQLIHVEAAEKGSIASGPHGRRRELAEGAGLFVPDRAGLWAVGGKEDTAAFLAAGVLDSAESDILPQVEGGEGLDLSPKSRNPLWLLVLGFAVVALAAEWSLFRRGASWPE